MDSYGHMIAVLASCCASSSLSAAIMYGGIQSTSGVPFTTEIATQASSALAMMVAAYLAWTHKHPDIVKWIFGVAAVGMVANWVLQIRNSSKLERVLENRFTVSPTKLKRQQEIKANSEPSPWPASLEYAVS